MAIQLPDLPYAFDALEPHIDAQTMEIHHDKHHEAYVDNLNTALEGTEWADQSIEDVIRTSTRSPRTSARPSATTAAGMRTTRSSGRSWARTAAATRRARSATRSTRRSATSTR